MEETKKQNDDEEFFYDLDEATEVVWENIPQYLRDKYDYEDIYFILELEFDYLDALGIMVDEGEDFPICLYPIDINQEEMEKYIVTTAIKNDIFLTYEELGDIMDAELIYYDINGALGDAGEFLN